MKIDPNSIRSIGGGGIDRVGGKGLEQARAVEGGGAVAGGGGADRLALSQRAEEMKAARTAMMEAPQVRADRVAELKAQVEAGTYQVDSDKVAERILNPRA